MKQNQNPASKAPKEADRVIHLLEKKILELTQGLLWTEVQLVMVREDAQALFRELEVLQEENNQLRALQGPEPTNEEDINEKGL